MAKSISKDTSQQVKFLLVPTLVVYHGIIPTILI